MLRSRILVMAGCLVIWAAAIQVRLVWLQVYQHDELAARATRQQRRTIPSPGQRGEILDRHGRTLALSAEADSIYAVPGEIEVPEKTAADLCGALDACGTTERDQLEQRFRQKRAFVYVRRLVSPAEARRVATLDLKGVGLLKESRRYYPNRELAAHVLGYVGLDSRGLGGIEAAYDRQISGRKGTTLIETDARHHAFSRVERPPSTGATIELTIDAQLQHLAERELRAGVAEHRAAGGTALIMDPRTGEILALANEPTFNPNSYGEYSDDDRRNRAVQDLYEPGSTFKIVTASAALEEHVFAPADPIDVSAGLIRIGARRIHDVHAYGVLNFTDVIVKSSNVGAIKVGLRLGPERLGRYVRRFGFGMRLCPDFPSENAGIVWDPAQWSDSAIASVSMGYQVGVTPLQMAAAVSSIANGGLLVQPRAVRALRQGAGRTEVAPRELVRTISAETAAVLTGIMEQVVERGTARSAAIPGFTVAGKTGTAAKLIDRHYSKAEYNASFIGFVPSRQPAFAIVVVIDSPREGQYFGGVVAAPVFKRIAEAALRQYGIPPTLNAAPPVMVAATAPAPGPVPVAASTANAAPPVEFVTDPPTVPDLRGLSARAAIRRLAHLGLVARVRGNGIVVEQDPPAGSPLDQGGACRLTLERVGPLGIAPTLHQ